MSAENVTELLEKTLQFFEAIYPFVAIVLLIGIYQRVKPRRSE